MKSLDESKEESKKKNRLIKYSIKIVLLVVGLILIFYVVTPRIHNGMYDRTTTVKSFSESISLLLNHIGFNKWVLNFILSTMLLLSIIEFKDEKQNESLIKGQKLDETRNSTKDFYKITYRRIDEKMEYPYMHQCFNKEELESLKERLFKDCECYDIKIYSCNLNERLIEAIR